jgi:antitoxin component YwqK of YwqJK toxin-antitoxin module
MNKKTLFILFLFAFLGCKTAPINQKIDKKKEGKWMDVYVQDNVEYKSIEYYKHDKPVKKWKTYINGKIYKTEKCKNGICVVKNYYENGKLEFKGNTKLEITALQSHWFYFGDWKFYSDKGKLKGIKKYENGELVSEQKINK